MIGEGLEKHSLKFDDNFSNPTWDSDYLLLLTTTINNYKERRGLGINDYQLQRALNKNTVLSMLLKGIHTDKKKTTKQK